MPTYVYECKACEKTIEVDQRITEDPLTDCDCGGVGTLKRVIQPTAVMFKGGGFYVNDSNKTSVPQAQPAEGECGNGGCASCTPATTAPAAE
ncbi:MAG: zinc ribbon domain-containing protein [Armatimonadetes bacterium]|nr:zinc ribbon domain-containing protein [Armatimonadota bacterium]